MAKAGNHGQVIPRDRELLHRLYWTEELSAAQMGKLWGVNHKSVGNVMRKLGVPMLSRGCKRLKSLCIDCHQRPPKLLAHKLTKGGTGTRCADCLRAYKRAWQKKNLARNPAVKEKRRQQMQRWYEQGPLNPKGEAQWITKARAALRSVKRVLKNRQASQSRNAASAPAATSPV